MQDVGLILKQYWRYPDFRPLQRDIIESAVAGKDTLALLPTGGGKSICFQVPGLALEGVTLVISPLIALMKDQVENLKKRNIKAEAIYSGMHIAEIDRILSNAMYGDLKFLYISPERLKTEKLLANLQNMKVSLIAIDEAHCISQWGYDFRPPYLEIAQIRPYFPETPIIALTATATPQVVDDIMRKLEFKEDNVFQKSYYRSNLIYITIETENKFARLIRIINKINGSGVVYVRNRRKTEEIASALNKNGISAAFYHAGMSSEDRDKTQKDWIENKQKVIVATNAFGMGIDKPDVRYVVHLDIPDSVEAYFQEAGRGGRDEKKAWAILLYDKLDLKELDNKFLESYPEIEFIRISYNAMCNYLQIPLESGKERSFEFDIVAFCKNYKLPMNKTFNALKFLEKEGYIMLSESFFKPSRLFFTCSQEELYRFQIENKKYDIFTKLILRTYGGLFSNFVRIQENDLANKMKTSINEIEKMLEHMESLNLLIYDKSSDKPLLVMLEDRLDENDIILSPKNYDFLKEQSRLRIEAMKQYVQNSAKCRSRQLLSYFGEENSIRCGECDVCLLRNRLSLSELEFDNVVKVIKPLLRQQEMSIEELVGSVDIFSEEKVVKVLQWLIDNEKVLFLDNNKYIWKSKD